MGLGQQIVWAVLWIGLVTLTIGLLVLMRTRWGQTQALGKCTGLSLLAHLLLAGYATTVQIVRSTSAPVDEPVIQVSFEDLATSSEEDRPERLTPQPWENVASAADSRPAVEPLARPAVALPEPAAAMPSTAPVSLPIASQVPVAAPEIPTPEAPPLASESPKGPVASEVAEVEESVEAPQMANEPQPALEGPARATPQTDDSSRLVDSPEAAPRPLTDEPSPLPALEDPAMPSPIAGGPAVPENSALKPLAPTQADDVASTGSDATAGATAGGSPDLVAVLPLPRPTTPELFKLRRAADKVGVARERGGTPESEAAVQAALVWLAKNQNDDGRWEAARHGAGEERGVLGHDRGGAGRNADTATTGLALLAFLGAGHTHQEGEYRVHVQHGLEFLLRSQAADGNLGGTAETYAFMYAHGIATLAVSEAYAMSGDKRLESGVRNAIGYTVRAQHRGTGSWRYRPGEPGDTSQLGWQLMALKSAELAGIEMPQATRDGMIRFLKTVSSGHASGLAAYRPGERATCSMTAEALVCRQFLGLARDNPSGDEAGDFLLDESPGSGRVNLYYWYYGTLGMCQLEGEHWERWNDKLQSTLLTSQVRSGEHAGSWEPDCIWGGHGGRVYSTAMSALCLEVYYRFLPLYGGKQEPGATAGKNRLLR